MIVDCGACSAQNFVSAERLAVREIPPRCWECGRPLPIGGGSAVPGGETVRETAGSVPESNGGTEGQ
jgi:hypothetical protein